MRYAILILAGLGLAACGDSTTYVPKGQLIWRLELLMWGAQVEEFDANIKRGEYYAKYEDCVSDVDRVVRSSKGTQQINIACVPYISGGSQNARDVFGWPKFN